MKLWKAHIGDLRLDQIKKAHIREFGRNRLATGVSTQTVNLDLISLRNVLNRALDDEHIAVLPTRNIRSLEVKTKKRGLVSSADIERICQAAFAATKPRGQEVEARGRPVTRNAQQFADYIRLMAFSGARREEALRLKWADVGFDREQITIGAGGLTTRRKVEQLGFPNEAIEPGRFVAPGHGPRKQNWPGDRGARKREEEPRKVHRHRACKKPDTRVKPLACLRD